MVARVLPNKPLQLTPRAASNRRLVPFCRRGSGAVALAVSARGAAERPIRQAAMVKLVRWALVPLAGIAVWYAVLLLGITGYSLLDRLCPPELFISGSCTAGWHGPAVEVLVLFCSAVVSAGIVMVPAFVAPARRFLVAVLAFACGAAFAFYAASGGTLWGPFLVSGLSGFASLWLAAAKWRGRALAA